MHQVEFCSRFDAAVVAAGVPCVLVPDRDGRMRVDEEWSRDAWTRMSHEPSRGIAWTLLRDRATGFITLALVLSPDLVVEHPRADIRAYASREEAERARAAFGHPPVCREPW